MNRLRITCLTLLLLLLGGAAGQAHAQQGDLYQYAENRFDEGDYEEAYEAYRELMERHPDYRPFFERGVNSLIQLQEFDMAVQLTHDRIDSEFAEVADYALLGEIHHRAGDQEQARQAWHDGLERYSERLRTYREMARRMNERREYEEAVEVYRQARQHFNNPELFRRELAEINLSAGHYRQAMQEYLDLLADNPNHHYTIQRQLTRYDQEQLYEVAIRKTEQAVKDEENEERVLRYLDLLQWLQIEQQQFERAVATAGRLDEQTEGQYHAQFELAEELRNRNQYRLAENAYTYYLQRPEHPLFEEAHEQLSATHKEHADYLQRHNLDYGTRSDSLYRASFDHLNELLDQNPSYFGKERVLVMLAELSLDHLYNDEQAENYLNRLQDLPEDMTGRPAMHNFLEGRLHLFRGDYNRARVAFTRSNNLAENEETAHRSRYFLGLTDFYSGDFEYAEYQLRALEQDRTSWYANNALRVRLWIQSGADPEETDGHPGRMEERGAGEHAQGMLNAFARAHYHAHTGERQQALEKLQPLLDASGHPLYGEVLLLGSRLLSGLSPGVSYRLLAADELTGLNASGKERLLWQRARLADYLYGATPAQLPMELPDDRIAELLPGNVTPLLQEEPSLDAGRVIEYYEQLLLEFPNGFYAGRVRERIRELEESDQPT